MNPNVYKKQCERALKRKLELIEYKGGKCEICGYDKNIATLDFHHINPDEKSFQLDSRHLSNTHIEKLLQEVNKCMLLCANCHREIHYPKFDKDNIINLLNECETKNIKINGRKQKYSICPVCGSEFPYVKGKIYCSPKCRQGNKHYPTYDEVMTEYEIVKSFTKVAQKFNLTRKIITNIVKKKKY